MNGNIEDLVIACFSPLICTDVKISLYLIDDRINSMQIAGLLLVGAVFFNDLCMLRLCALLCLQFLLTMQYASIIVYVCTCMMCM